MERDILKSIEKELDFMRQIKEENMKTLDDSELICPYPPPMESSGYPANIIEVVQNLRDTMEQLLLEASSAIANRSSQKKYPTQYVSYASHELDREQLIGLG